MKDIGGQISRTSSFEGKTPLEIQEVPILGKIEYPLRRGLMGRAAVAFVSSRPQTSATQWRGAVFPKLCAVALVATIAQPASAHEILWYQEIAMSARDEVRALGVTPFALFATGWTIVMETPRG